MPWILSVRDKVYKQLKEFPVDDSRRILFVFELMRQDPYSGDIVSLGETGFRRRVGSYRIFYEIRKYEQVVYIYKIERRTSKTY